MLSKGCVIAVKGKSATAAMGNLPVICVAIVSNDRLALQAISGFVPKEPSVLRHNEWQEPEIAPPFKKLWRVLIEICPG